MRTQRQSAHIDIWLCAGSVFRVVGHADRPQRFDADGLFEFAHGFALEGKRRSPARHAQAGHLAEEVQQFVADALGEILVVLFAVPIVESEHRDGLLGGGTGGRPRRRIGEKLFESLVAPQRIENRI